MSEVSTEPTLAGIVSGFRQALQESAIEQIDLLITGSDGRQVQVTNVGSDLEYADAIWTADDMGKIREVYLLGSGERLRVVCQKGISEPVAIEPEIILGYRDEVLAKYAVDPTESVES